VGQSVEDRVQCPRILNHMVEGSPG
jgi:hypothetical protein